MRSAAPPSPDNAASAAVFGGVNVFFYIQRCEFFPTTLCRLTMSWYCSEKKSGDSCSFQRTQHRSVPQDHMGPVAHDKEDPELNKTDIVEFVLVNGTHGVQTCPNQSLSLATSV